ncbi:MAG: heme o synthase, partial [Gaiellales bacterium]|nr:heme o synthase [Gaiellales bacterium]
MTTGATTGLAPAAGLGTHTRAADYWELLKPRIMLLIVVTTVGSLALAAGGWPGSALVLWTVLGMMLVSGGSSAINHWYDRDIDALMARTSARPVASGRVPPAAALTFGLVLGAAGVGVLALRVHWLAAVWAVAGFLCYVLVYTVWLKRRTPQNIVIGGAAGAVPPLVAWAAVDGSVSATAVALFAVVFLWTPPHFWALALLLEEDYSRAGVPMLPSVRGSKVSAQQILVYTVLLVAASLVPVVLGTLGIVYAVAAAVLGGRFIWLARRLLRSPDDRVAARRTFLYSLLYLALVFVAMGGDSALGQPGAASGIRRRGA